MGCGRSPRYEYMGISVSGAGDLNGDGIDDVVYGVQHASVYGPEAGAAVVLRCGPILSSDHWIVFDSMGGNVYFSMDFLESEGEENYGLLMSESGVSPTWVFGKFVPLTMDPFLNMMLSGSAPSAFVDPYGVLDPDGDGACTQNIGPSQVSSHVYDTFHLVVVGYETGPLVRHVSNHVSLLVCP